MNTVFAIRTLSAMLLLTYGTLLVLGQSKSNVQVHVTDTYGLSVPAEWVKISGPVITEVKQDLPVSLPFGQYKVEVLVRGFSIARESVLISHPVQIVTIGMGPPTLEGQTGPPVCAIFGQIAGELKADRIRAIELFGSMSVEVPVAADGRFDFRYVQCGDYLVIAFGPSKVMVNPSHLLGTAVMRASRSVERVQVTLKQ